MKEAISFEESSEIKKGSLTAKPVEISPRDDRWSRKSGENGVNGHHESEPPRAEKPLPPMNAELRPTMSASVPAFLSPLPFTLEQLFAASGDGVLVLGPERCIRYANPAADSLYARPTGGLTDLSFDELYPPEIIPEEKRPLDHLFCRAQTEQNLVIEERECPFDGRLYECRAQCLTPGDPESAVLLIMRDVDELRSAQARFERAMEAANEGLWETDYTIPTEDGEGVAYRSPGWKKIVGVGNEEACPEDPHFRQALLDRMHPEDRVRYQKARQEAFMGTRPFLRMELRLRQVDGSYRWVVMRSKAHHNKEGLLQRVTGILSDVHDRKQAELAILEAHARFERAAAATNDGIWEHDFINGTDYRSARWKEMAGIPDDMPDNLPALDNEEWRSFWSVRIHPEDWERVERHCRGYYTQTGRIEPQEYRLRNTAGEFRWVAEHLEMERDAEGALLRIVGVVKDIHDRKTQEQEVIQASARFERAIQASRDAIWEVTFYEENGCVEGILYRSPQFWKLFGFEDTPPEVDPVTGRWLEFDGTDLWRSRIHPEDFERLHRYRSNIFDTSVGITETEYRILRNDGQYRWVASQSRLERDEHGRVVFMTGVLSDIHEQKEAARQAQAQDEAIRRSEERYRLITEAGFEGIFRADPNGNIFAASPHLLIAFGKDVEATEATIREIDLIALMHPAEREHVLSLWQQTVTNGTSLESEARIRVQDGSYRRWRVRAVPLRDRSGRIQEWLGTVSDITEQFEAEMRLRESEARLKEAQRITHSGHFRYEIPSKRAGAISGGNFWSDEMYRIFERDPAAGPPSEAYTARYYAAEDLLRLQTAQERARNNGMPYIAELPIVTERGTTKWIQLHHRAEYNAHNQVVAVYGAVVDITAFKALEDSLRQAQQLARRIALAVPDLLYVYDVEGGQTRYANRSMAQVLGFGPEDPELLAFPNAWTGVGDSVQAFISSRVHPVDALIHLAATHQLRSAADGEVIEVVSRLRNKDGNWRTFYCREIIFARDETTGAPREVLGVAQDITEKLEAEDLRRESEEKYRSLVDLLSDWVWECDQAGHYVYISGQVTRRIGYRPEEMIGLSLIDFAQKEDRERLSALFQGYVQRKQAFTRLPVRVVGITGESIYLEVSGVPLISSEGEIYGFRGVAYDVTIRKQTEDQLRSSEERTRRVIESSPDCMQILDLAGRLLSVNEAGRRLLAISDVHGVRGAYWPSFWEGEWRQVAEDSVTRAGSGETRRFIGFTRSLHGEGLWWDVVVTPLPNSQGLADQLLVVARDISAQKSLEQQKDQLLADAMQRAERDPLTGLYDHQAFHKRLQEEGRRADRDQIPFAVAVLDVDNFKYFNDAFGHLEGDAVLLHITNALRSTCRPTDTIGRLGGDEFAVILPGVLKQDAMRLLESRLQANAFASRWQPRGYDAPIPLRISFGVAVYPDEASAPLSTLSLADERLYRNKKEGQAGLLEHLRAELGKTMVGFPMLDALVTAVDSKDRYTRKHSEDVLIYAVMIGQQLGLSEEELSLLRPAALLHDVGKIGVSQRILRLPAALTAEEYEAIKQHAPLGAALIEVLLEGSQNIGSGPSVPLPLTEATKKHRLSPPSQPTREQSTKGVPTSQPRLIPPDHLRKLVAAVRHHHESWDGKGYPDGLRGEEIPLLARVLAVADAFSALTTDRPYRRGANPEQAVAVLRAGSGQQWDSECVAAFLQVVETSRTRALAALGALSDTPTQE